MATGSNHTSYEQIQQAARFIRDANHVLALTGAGISTPSGIPDFRSADTGLWTSADPMTVASLQGFRERPESFYEWVRPLAKLLITAEPNAAHYALAQLEAGGFLHGIITQNIDLLHGRAGSEQMYEVHGHVRETTCIRCFHVYPGLDRLAAFIDDGIVPLCPICNGVLKPNVILFGEQLPAQVMLAAEQAMRACDVMLVAGSSLEVFPVADLPAQARAHGAKLIIVNREPTPLDSMADVVIHADVATALPEIAEVVLNG